MVLTTTSRARERILLFGLEGVGKSLGALDIAARVTPNRVWVIDNDNAWDRMIEGATLAGDEVAVAEEYRWNGDETKGRFERDETWEVEGGNVVIFHTEGWIANTTAIEQVVARAERDDWWVIDTGSSLWDDVQAWFTQTVFNADMADYFMDVRTKKAKAASDAKALGALDGWVDWPVINTQYKRNVMKWLVNPPCHLMVICEQADVTGEEKDREVLGLYRSWSVKPRGQKRLGHNMQTVMLLTRDRSDRFYATTVKDRGGRERVTQFEVSDVGFAEWYLAGIGGWVDEDVQGEEEPVVEAPRTKGRG